MGIVHRSRYAYAVALHRMITGTMPDLIQNQGLANNPRALSLCSLQFVLSWQDDLGMLNICVARHHIDLELFSNCSPHS